MEKIEILNLYCGIGGNRKLWDDNKYKITAVELNEEIAEIYHKNFPKDRIIIADAHQYLLENYKRFPFIWSSPPCPTHSEMRRCATYKGQVEPMFPDMALYQEIIFLKYFAKKETQWSVENVKPYYDPLIKPQVVLGRHYFWSNFYIPNKYFDNEEALGFTTGKSVRYGFDLKNISIQHRKDQILRNLVDPKIGEYVLSCSIKKQKPLFNFDF